MFSGARPVGHLQSTLSGRGVESESPGVVATSKESGVGVNQASSTQTPGRSLQFGLVRAGQR